MVLEDFGERKKRVCKPCWELKYRPYGPLVEQAPLLPTEKAKQSHILNISNGVCLVVCIYRRKQGKVSVVFSELPMILQQWLYQLEWRKRLFTASRFNSKKGQMEAWIGNGDLPQIHVYRVAFDANKQEICKHQFKDDTWNELQEQVVKIKKIEEGLEKGFRDHRTLLEGRSVHTLKTCR